MLKLAVERRVVDQALPADRRARLLEVDAHHDEQVVAEVLGHAREALRVVERRDRVVDRAGPDHHEQPVVLAREDAGRSRRGSSRPAWRRFSPSGSSSIRIAGGISGRSSWIRRSSVRCSMGGPTYRICREPKAVWARPGGWRWNRAGDSGKLRPRSGGRRRAHPGGSNSGDGAGGCERILHPVPAIARTRVRQARRLLVRQRRLRRGADVPVRHPGARSARARALQPPSAVLRAARAQGAESARANARSG